MIPNRYHLTKEPDVHHLASRSYFRLNRHGTGMISLIQRMGMTAVWSWQNQEGDHLTGMKPYLQGWTLFGRGSFQGSSGFAPSRIQHPPSGMNRPDPRTRLTRGSRFLWSPAQVRNRFFFGGRQYQAWLRSLWCPPKTG